jgi:hypothetical protein
MEVRVRSLKFRYALCDTADASEIHRMLEDCPFQAEKIETNGLFAEVFLTYSVRQDDADLNRFMDRMNEYGYKLGFNNES